MLSSATGQRTGLRGRNVEDVSELEEKGLLRHVDYDDDGSERETRRRDKGKEKETRVERVADYSDGSDEGLNNPRDRNAFALLVLLCEFPLSIVRIPTDNFFRSVSPS
jgi:hypothetical protein